MAPSSTADGAKGVDCHARDFSRVVAVENVPVSLFTMHHCSVASHGIPGFHLLGGGGGGGGAGGKLPPQRIEIDYIITS